MKNAMNNAITTIEMALALVMTVCAQQPASAAMASREQAQQILKETGVTGGLVAQAGCGEPADLAALSPNVAFTVVELDNDADANLDAEALEMKKKGKGQAPASAICDHPQDPHGKSITATMTLSLAPGVITVTANPPLPELQAPRLPQIVRDIAGHSRSDATTPAGPFVTSTREARITFDAVSAKETK